MAHTKYRTTNMIILTILEGILRVRNPDENNKPSRKGIVKSQLIKYSGLKTTTAEKYLSKMESADYIRSEVDYWGERKVTMYYLTKKGRERYEWFLKINAEFE